MGNAFVEQLLECCLDSFEGLRSGVLVEHQDQLIAQGLTQFQTQVEGDEVVTDQLLPGFRPSASR